MNIFVLDTRPWVAARGHCDKHVVKMITETAQLISTHRRLNGEDANDLLYRKTHINHPCRKWLDEAPGNIAWLNVLLGWLLHEYDSRFGKTDNFQRSRMIYYDTSGYTKAAKMSSFKLCVPDKYKIEGDPVASYRNYYIGEKAGFAEWRNGAPEWWTCL